MSSDNQEQPPIDPALQRSIDDEFAELERELARLESPQLTAAASDPNGIISILNNLHAEWSKRAAEKPDRTMWEKRLDDVFRRAMARLVAAGQTIDAQGNLGFALDQKAVQAAIPELAAEAAKGLEQQFIDKWTKKPASPAEKPTVDASDLAAIVATLMAGRKKKP